MDIIAIIRDLIDQGSVFAQANPFIALAILIVLAYLIYRKPFFFISVFILGLILVGVLYVIFSISVPGVSEKEKLIQKGSGPENSFSSQGMKL